MRLDAGLDEFYQEYGDVALDDALFSKLRNLIVSASIAAGYAEPQPKRTVKLLHSALNNRLKRLKAPYSIQADGGTWRFVKLTGEGGDINA